VLISLHGRSALVVHAFVVGGVLHQLHRVEMLRALLQSSLAATRRGFRVYGGVGRNVSSKVLVGSTSTT
jgi:hypothetical protein